MSLNRKSVYLLIVIILCSTLIGCPIPYTNRMYLQQDAPLPYPKQSNKALVYVIQPTTSVDWSLIGGAFSDANRYFDSKLYLKTDSSDFAYISSRHGVVNFCFYVDPGTYTLKFINPGAEPESLKQQYILTANSVRFLGLDLTTYSGGAFSANLKLVELSEGDGRGYLAKSRTPACTNVTKQFLLDAYTVNITQHIKVNNNTANYLILNDEDDSESNDITIDPGKSYTVTKTYSRSDNELNDFYEYNRVHIEYSKDGHSIEYFAKGKLYIDSYMNPSENKFNIDILKFRKEPIINGQGECQADKGKTKITVNCKVDILPKSVDSD